VGAAYGAVLSRLGDIYSPVVNLASRLTSLARPNALLVDRELASRLHDVAGYRVRPLRRVSVRGYDHLQPWLVRRRDAADSSGYDEDSFGEDEPDAEDMRNGAPSGDDRS
jgi:adenylate cyclase